MHVNEICMSEDNGVRTLFEMGDDDGSDGDSRIDEYEKMFVFRCVCVRVAVFICYLCDVLSCEYKYSASEFMRTRLRIDVASASCVSHCVWVCATHFVGTQNERLRSFPRLRLWLEWNGNDAFVCEFVLRRGCVPMRAGARACVPMFFHFVLF